MDIFSFFGGGGTSSVHIGGNAFSSSNGQCISITDGVVLINGQPLDPKLAKDIEVAKKIEITVNIYPPKDGAGEKMSIKTGAIGGISVNGAVETVETTNGQVTVKGDVLRSVETTNGTVQVAGSITGDARTTNGSITATSIGGRASSVNGTVNGQRQAGRGGGGGGISFTGISGSVTGPVWIHP